MENRAREDGFDRYGDAAINPDEDAAFFYTHQAELTEAYDGRFIAIRGGQVVADGETYFELHASLCRRFGEPTYAYIRKVTPASFERPGTDTASLIV